MIKDIIKYPQLIIFKNLIVSLYSETSPFLTGEVFGETSDFCDACDVYDAYDVF